MASSIGMAVFVGLEIRDEGLAVLDLTDAWRVVWFVAWIVMIANLILAFALHHRARRRRLKIADGLLLLVAVSA